MEQIWFKDLRGFMTEANFMIFFPSTGMSFAEQLNAILRFSIYLSLIIMLVKKDTAILFAPILCAIITYLLYSVEETKKTNDSRILEGMHLREEKQTRNVCQKPTPDNPFMNVLMSDYKDNPTRASACKLQGRAKNEAKRYFDRNLYRDVDDIFQKNASDRQWYTNPSTTIPNDASGFAQWLYGTPPTCKEGNGSKCYRNLHNNFVR